ncbi:beta strand repeat-containing protein [Candidatus Methanoprimaticola sp. MG2]|uniref:beta strand repeat-containing protein n=1 Tax=Candidatus Methanoprimaticola sp. MG2 TaxID=3228838 RepID=UPI0039C63B7A
MKTNKMEVTGGGQCKLKLLAAVAVLAIAFAVFAAVPAVAEDSDAADGASVIKTEADLTKAIETANFDIKLGDDIELTNWLTISKKGTLDLGEYTLSSKAEGGRVMYITNSGELTLKASGSGKIFSDSSNYTDDKGTERAAAVVNVSAKENSTGGILNMVSGKIESDAYGVAVWSNGTANISGGTIVAGASTVSGNGTQSNCKVNISGGTFTSTGSPAIYWPSSSKLDITGGTFTGIGGFDIRNAEVSIKNATVNVSSVDTKEQVVGTDGPASFPVGIGIYGWQNGKAYGNPDVTIENVTINGDRICDVYFGVLKGGDETTATKDFKTATSVTGITNVNKTTMSLTIKEGGSEKFKFNGLSATAGTALMLDLGSSITALESSVFNCDVAVGGTNVVTIGAATAGEDGITISEGSVVIEGKMTATDTQIKIEAAKGDVKIGDLEITSGNLTLKDTEIIGNLTATTSTIAVDGGVTVAKDKKLDVKGLTVNADAMLVNNGTISTADAPQITGNIYATSGSTTTLPASTNDTNIVKESGATVTVNDEDAGKDVSEVGKVTAANFGALEALCNAGVAKIELSGSTAIPVTADLRIKDTTTLYLASAALSITSGVTLTNDGKIVSGSAPTTGTSGDDIVFVNGTFVNNGVLEIEGNLTVPVECKFFNNETMTITGTLTVLGEFENSGTLTCTMKDANDTDYAIVVGNGTAKSLFENSGLLYVANDIEVKNTAKFENSGAIAAGEDTNGDKASANDLIISGAGTFENIGKGVVGFAVNTSTVIGVAYDVEMTVDITQDTTYGTLQNVIVPEGKTLTIQRTASLTIMGKLIVYGTLNVEGNLVIASSTGASMEVAGTVNIVSNKDLKGTITIGSAAETGHLVVDAGAKLAAQDGTTLDLADGSVVVDGALEMQTGSILKSAVATDLKAETKDVKANGIVFSKDAQVALNGIFNGTVEMLNFGSVVVDNGANTKASKAGAFEIQLASADANVVIKSIILIDKTDSAKVTDLGMVVKASKDGNVTVTDADDNSVSFSKSQSNTVTYTILTGELTIAEKVSSKKVDGKVQYTNAMDVSGQVSAANKYSETVTVYDTAYNTGVSFIGGGVQTVSDNETVSKVTGGITVEGDLILGACVALTNGGYLYVNGSIANDGTDAQQIVNNGTITVLGLITCSAEIDNKGTINAASYVIKNTVEKKVITTYCYASFETAVEAVADPTNENTLKGIVLMGNNTVLNSLEVPAGVAVTFEGRPYDGDTATNVLFVGDSKHRDVILTFADGATMTTTGKGQVDVDATLTFADKNDDETQGTISDVKVESEAKDGPITYTNIYYALGEADDGDVVTVTRTTGTVDITQSLTVPAGVTLVVPDNATNLKVFDGMTLTIDGTLVTDLEILAEHIFSTTAMDVPAAGTTAAKESSVIVVNGTLKMNSVLGFAYGADTANNRFVAPVAGAYYEIDGYDYVSTLAIAVSQAAVAESDIVINGIVTAGDIEFTGTDNCSSIIVSNSVVYGMDEKPVYTALSVSSLKIIDGALVATGGFNGTVNVSDAAFTASKVAGVTVTDDETNGMVITGTIDESMGTKFGEASASLTAGTAVMKGTSQYVDFTVAAGATLVSDGAKFNVEYSIDYEPSGILYIDGAVSVASAKNLDAGIVVINDGGSLSVAATTETTAPGVAKIEYLFVGLDFEDVYTLGAAASVSGPVTVTYAAYVAAGSTVDEVAQKIMDAKPHTEFFIEDSLWMTVYDFTTYNTMYIDQIQKAPVENAEFDGVWKNEKGEDTENIDVKIGQKDWTIAKAVIDYDIYTVYVYANEGIANIYIDGNAMEKGLIPSDNGIFANGFSLKVSAGEHEITYDLTNGWTGSAVFKVNGDAINGNKFTTTGTPGEADTVLKYTIQISGLEKSGYVPDAPDSKDDSSMGITDYLLIILVVLIVVMAIIVAMRLMRS